MKTVGDIIYTEQEVSGWAYLASWVALLVLLFITWRVAYARLGDFNLIVAMVIAVLKCAIVIWYFMDLRSSPKLVILLFGMALAMVFIAAVLTFSDYLTRANDREAALAPAYDLHLIPSRGGNHEHSERA